MNLYEYAYNNPTNYVDPDGELAFLAAAAIVWGVAEVGLSVYDGFIAAKTFLDPCASAGDKALTAGLFAAGVASIGGGYTLGAKAIKSGAPKVGQKVYRVFGDEAISAGKSYTTVNPNKIKNVRKTLGLPNKNTGRFVVEGELKDTAGVISRKALPLDGNAGGGAELIIPNPAKQVLIKRVSGVNPQF